MDELKGIKHDSGKVLMGCIPPTAEVLLGMVLTYGAQKYTKTLIDISALQSLTEDALWLNKIFVPSVINSKVLPQEVCVQLVTVKKRIPELYALAATKNEELPQKMENVVLVMNENDLLTVLKNNKELLSTKDNIVQILNSELKNEHAKNNADSTQNTLQKKHMEASCTTCQNTAYPLNNINIFVCGDAQYVEAQNVHTLTMTIRLVNSEICFVVNATKLWDCCKILLTLLKHFLNISLNIQQVYKSNIGRENWRLIDNLEDRYMDACLRHINLHRRGEEIDPESGLPHLGHAVACLMFLLEVSDKAYELNATLNIPEIS